MKEHDVKDLLSLSLADAKYIIKYLKHFGYIQDDFKLEEIAQAVVKFQSFFNLKKDGVLGPKTLKAMKFEKRCGVPDIWHPGLGARGKWNKNKLTFTVKKNLDNFSRQEFIDIVELGYNQWEKWTNISVSYTDLASADIVVTTGKGQQSGFDGPSGILAWANLPPGNDQQLNLVFDEDETWLQKVPNAGRGIYLLNVACHEGGHTLGLDHSQIKSALMAPYYSPDISAPQQNDDIPRIQAVYGKNSNPTPAPTPTPTPTPTPNPNDLVHVELWVKNIDRVSIPNFRVTKIN